MSDDKLHGVILTIPIIIVLLLLVMVDKHYLNSRMANLFKQSKFRLLFMFLIFITVMLSSFYWRTEIRL